MRSLSPKTRARQAEARPIRDALKDRVSRCELCLRPCHPDLLSVHEICNGPLRQKALDQPYALLVLHWIEPWSLQTCHADVQAWSEARQLALLYLVDQSRYDLKAYLTLTNPRAMKRITHKEVMAEADQLLATRLPEIGKTFWKPRTTY